MNAIQSLQCYADLGYEIVCGLFALERDAVYDNLLCLRMRHEIERL